MTDFRDEHDALERELLDYFRQVLGPRLVAPMADELKAAVRDGLAGLSERERRIDEALRDLQNDRLALANATREQGAAVAADARRRLADAPSSAATDPAAMAAIESRIEALAGDIRALAKRGGGASPGPAGVSRNQLLIGGGLLAALSLTLGLILGGLLLPWGRSADRREPPAIAETQQAADETGGTESAAETPVDQGWSVLRAANAEVCGTLTGEDCTFGVAWQRADTTQRRAMMQAALDLLAARARANYPACARARTAAPQVTTWTAATATTLTNLGGCLGVEAPEVPARNPTDAQQQEVMTWTLARLSTEAAR